MKILRGKTNITIFPETKDKILFTVAIGCNVNNNLSHYWAFDLKSFIVFCHSSEAEETKPATPSKSTYVQSLTKRYNFVIILVSFHDTDAQIYSDLLCIDIRHYVSSWKH